jgi:hypothetical protein
MRRAVFLIVFALAACGQPAQQTASSSSATTSALAATPAMAAGAAPIWFFCDGIDAPVVYLFGDSPDDGHTRFIEYDKLTGATVRSLDLDVGEGDGAAGSVFFPLTQNGQDFGHVRQVQAGNFETPAAAYTTPYTSVQIGDKNVACRWLPRTRVAGFTGRRSFVIHEDADGDLIYTTFDFAHAATQPIDQSDNGRSTRFSVEVRDGQENVQPGGSDFTFAGQDGYSYAIHLDPNGTGTLRVLRNGAQVQSEPITAYLVGQAQSN